MYLLGIPDWLFWWGFVALMLALLLLACNLCLTDDSVRGHFKCFFYSLSCFLPCLGCLLCCYLFCFQKIKCKLCGKRVWGAHEHRKRCRERPAYEEIPDSPMYNCQNCNTHLKVWPTEKVESMDCVSPECFEKVKNNGENVHLCFICDMMVCPKHNRNPEERINIDFSNPESVTIITDYRGSEDGSRNENSGFPDPRRQSIAEGSNFFPSDPSVSPTFDNSSPSAPPTYGSNHSPMICPYASPSNTSEHPPELNPHNPPNVNTYNPPQQSDDLFPDLPPSYEVAMMDESDMC